MIIKEETVKLAKENGFEIQQLNMGFNTIAKLMVDDNDLVGGSEFHRLIVVNSIYLEEKNRSMDDEEFNNIIINEIKKFIDSYNGKPYLRSIETEKSAIFPYSDDVVKQEVKKYGEFLDSSFCNEIVSAAVENDFPSTGKEQVNYTDKLLEKDPSYSIGTKKED